MSELKHLLITKDGQAPSRFIDTFPKATILALADDATPKAEFVWFKLQPLEEIQPQIEWLIKHYPNQRFIVLTTIPNLAEAIYCLKAGARAYANVHAGPQTLVQIADVVRDGGVWVGEDLMQYLVASLSKAKQSEVTKHDQAWRTKLSQREVEVVDAIARGASNKLVARELDITERTVKAHVTAIFEKLGVKDRLKLVLMVTGQ
jgi:two-component system, NarL family, nitrate/nitrite response regulator NarL